MQLYNGNSETDRTETQKSSHPVRPHSYLVFFHDILTELIAMFGEQGQGRFDDVEPGRHNFGIDSAERVFEDVGSVYGTLN